MISEVIRVLEMEGRAILTCAERFRLPHQAEELTKLIKYCERSLEQGGKIVVTGVGKSGKIGQKIAATLCSTGSLAVFLHPTEGVHGDLGVVRPQDTVLALSYTGNTTEVVELLPTLRNLGVAIVGLGGNADSKLAKGCDAWIDGSVEKEACPHNSAPTTSTTVALALGDALAVTLMQLRGFDEAAFALNHPGGSIGKKLSLKVKDLMHQGKDVPTVGASTSMEEVIDVSTQMKLGAVLVVQSNQLLGLITDGDIRRALKHRDRFFDMTAEQVMTRNPVTANPEMMANTALRLMEDRKSQISVLPVVDSSGVWKGLLRLHDLVRSF